MKFKFLSIVCLAAVAGLAGCGGSENTNKANVNANANVVTNTATAPAPMKDAAVQAAVEDAMKKKGFTDVQVDATTTGVTLRGTVEKGKMTEAVQAAQEAAKEKSLTTN